LLPGNLGPDAIGTLAPDATCLDRQEHRDPAALPRVPSFGAGGAGYYTAEPKNQYFDYAYTILDHQCAPADGFYGCNSTTPVAPAPGRWNNYSSQAYAILVLQRATGGVCVDADKDGVCDEEDNCPVNANPGQEDQDQDGVGNACDNCPNTPNPDQKDTNGNGIGDACEAPPPQVCDVDKDGDIDKLDLALISKARGQVALPGDARDANLDGIIDPRDVKICIPKCTRASCAVQ
jgi:hypothetical protein